MNSELIQSYLLDFNKLFHLFWYKSVTNMEQIMNKLIKSSEPFEDCIIINPQLVLHPFQIVIAANKSVVAKYNEALITKTLPTELLFNLSCSSNISQSLALFGYSSNCSEYLLLGVFEKHAQQVSSILSYVKGTLLDINNTLSIVHNLDLIKKTYDITNQQMEINTLLDIIVTKIACTNI